MSESTSSNLTFGHYLVAFVDLLGQREKLRKLDALPRDENGLEYREFVQTVKQTVGAVYDLQKTAKQFFHAFTGNTKDSPLDVLPGFRRLNSSDIKFQHFSDGLLIYVPLRTDDQYSPAKGVYGALAACGGLCLIGLAKKWPVRIGVSIGVAAELNENELYGKAIADAYELESNVAQYPRVVVSNEVSDYLLGYANIKCDKDDLGCQITKKMAESSLKMLARDFDGRFIVSYLGDFFRNQLMSGIDEFVYENAKSFIDEELKRHQEAQNSKLAFRYSLLHGYFHEHLATDEAPLNK
jgi:hypothetical protein